MNLDIENIIEMVLPLVTAAFRILQNSDLMNALLHSNKLTNEQREIITRMRKAAVAEFDQLAPDETVT